MSAPALNPILCVSDLAFQVQDLQILQGISLDIQPHEFVCIVGSSGCGKTTLLRLLAGLLTPTHGQVPYKGQQVQAPHPELAVVFQDYGRALLPWRTVYGNVELALEARQVPRAQRAELIHGLLAQDRKSTRLNSSHIPLSRMPSSA